MISNDAGGRIKSLREPTKKMSKSDPDPKSCLMITDTPDAIIEKLKKSITDFTSEVTYEPERRLGVTNLLTIHSLITGTSTEQICNDVKGLNTGQYKLVVADAIIAHMNPIRVKIEDYLKNPDYLTKILQDGNNKARVVAEKTMEEVKHKVGLGS